MSRFLLKTAVFSLALTAVLFALPQAADAALETTRPASHTDDGVNSTSPGQAYDASGNATEATTPTDTNNTPSIRFYNLSAAGETYDALDLAVEYRTDTSGDDQYAIQYSTDNTSGACDSTTWTDLVALTAADAGTHTIATTTISASQDLTTVCVRVNTSKVKAGDGQNVYIEDVRTIGTFAPPMDVSGTLYSDEGDTAITSGKTINLAVATGSPATLWTTTSDGSGAFTFSDLGTGDFATGTPLLLWVDDGATTRGAVLTKASSTISDANITGLNIYQNRLITRHEATSGTSTTNADLSFYDHDDDPEIQFTSVAGGEMSLLAGQELHIWTGTEYAPGGAVTLHGNAQATLDGDLHLETAAGTSSILTLGGTLTMAGSWFASSTSIINANGNGVLFNATTTGKSIYVPSANASFASTTFNGAGGAWTFQTPATTTGNLTISAGTLTAPSGESLYIGGDYENAGTFTHNSGTVFFNGSSAQSLSGTMTGASAFNDTDFSGASTKTFAASASTSALTIASGATLTAPSTLLTVAGSYTNNGNFTDNAGTVYFDGAITLAGELTGSTDDFNDVIFIGAGTKTLAANASTSALTVSAGTLDVSGRLVTIDGTFTQNGTLTTDASSLLYFGGSGDIAGTLTGASELRDIEILASRTFTSSASTTNLTITAGTLTAPSTLLSISGNYTNSGTFTANSGTTTVNGTAAQTFSGTMTGTSAFAGIEILNSSATTTFSAAASTTGTFLAQKADTRIAFFSGATSTFQNFTINGQGAGTEIYLHANSGWDLSTASYDSVSKSTNSSGEGEDGPLGVAFKSDGTKMYVMGLNTDSVHQYTLSTAWDLSTASYDSVSTSTNSSGEGESVPTGVAFKSDGTKMYVIGTITDSVHQYSVSGADEPWIIHVPGTNSVNFANIKDSDACSNSANLTATDSVDGTGNTCWDFGAANPTISSDANQVFDVGASAQNISTITITDASTPTITAANDLRILIATTSASIDMTWDTADTSASFGGSASGKVSSPVSFEGQDSVLVIPVDTDFAADDTLTISGLRFASFNTVTVAAAALEVEKDGPVAASGDATDDKTIAIRGTTAIATPDTFQEPNKMDISGNSITDAELFGFKLTPTGENVTVANLTIDISLVKGFTASNFTNMQLFRDYDGAGDVDATDEQVGGAGNVTVFGTTGTVSFNESFSASTTLHYILQGDVSSIGPGDELSLDLFASNATSTGAISGELITPTGSVTLAYHARIAGFGVGGGIGDGGPDVEDQGGGGEGSGETIGSEPGFNAPTALGSTFSEWGTPANAFDGVDGTRATEATTWDRQDYANFGFSVPSGNEITGIEVKLEARVDAGSGGTIRAELSWNGGTATTSANKQTSALTTTDTVYNLGASSDTWGRTWAPSEFNDGNFELRLVALPNANTVEVDEIQVKVHHQSTGGGGGGGGEVKSPLDPARFLALSGAAADLIFKKFLAWIMEMRN